MMPSSSLFEYCIYTMKKSDNLDYCYRNGGTGTFSERKNWKTGYELYKEAKSSKKKMIILFSAAEEESGIIYIAELDRLKIDEKEKEKTIYSFGGMIRLFNARSLSSLVLKSKQRNLSDNYIRPYAICKTPIDLNDWIVENGIPPVTKRRLTGMEPFHTNKKDLKTSLLDFWQWSSSDLTNNLLRGIFAEYIVARSLGLADGIRSAWDAYDLQLPNGTKIEVKSASYIQSWYQKRHSDIIFRIPRTIEWNEETNIQSGIPKRQADIYVFCVLRHKIQDTIDPLNLDQWEFYVLSTRTIEERMGDRDSITLSKLKGLDPVKVTYAKLKDCIENITK